MRLLGGAVGVAASFSVMLAAVALTAVIRVEGFTPPEGWLQRREQFVRAQASRFPALAPRLPLLYRLDRDFVAAARSRQSIEVVDDCGQALCGVVTDELPEEWEIADLRAMFTPPDAPRRQRDAYATALLGRFRGEDIDQWAADELRAGLFHRWKELPQDDALIDVPVSASLIRFLDPRHRMSFDAIRKRLQDVEDRPWLAKLRAITARPRNHATSQPIHGATFSIVNRIERSAIAEGSSRELERLRRIGYNAITLLPFAGQRGSDGTELRRFARHPASETDLAISLTAARAHRLGLCVLIKPHVWNSPIGDPTQIDPGPAWPKWFESYRAFIIHEALLARAVRADWFSIGTELSRSEHRPEWSGIIAVVRAIFSGPITYAANFDAFEKTPFWDALDAIGIDAYFPLATSPQASEAELRSGAEKAIERIERKSRQFQKPAILMELGYPSTSAPWIEPWHELRDSPPAPAEQARAFGAMLDSASRSPSVLGFIIWKYESDPNLVDSKGYLPREKPAEAVIQKHLGHVNCSK